MRVRGLSLVMTGWMAFGLATAPAVFAASPAVSCFTAVGKEARDFFTKRLRSLEECREAELREPGACPLPYPGAFDGLIARLAEGIVRHCDAVPLGALGFPGPCFDPDASDGFSADDLATCIQTSHSAATDAMLSILYDPALVPPVRYADFNCQKAVGRKSAAFARTLLGAVQKCRLGILGGKIRDIRPERCAVDHAPTQKIIAKAERRLRRLIDGRCSDAQATRLRLCTPDQPLVTSALDCLIQAITRSVDDPDPTAPSDLIDYEFAARPRPFCGDDHVDSPGEECDGTADDACPGACGAANGLFPCLCQNVPRQRVIEHFDADFDLWSFGSAHDQHVPEGGGYLADLWDCDGAEGPDTRCTVGPSCSFPPHSPCSPGPTDLVTGNSICGALGQGTCRKTAAGATGPHCMLDFQQRCATNAECPADGDRCLQTLHGPPLAVSAGSVPMCLVRIFSEDVVGTTDLATGEGDVRVRQRLLTYLGGSVTEPCPVCGGFCAGASAFADPGLRSPCATDADCPNPPYHCVTEAVCSYGPNVDAACRPGPPFGGPTAGFGTTSMDCLPPSAANLTGPGLDLLENPRTTRTVTIQADVACSATNFSGNACIGGASDGRPCFASEDCPDGVCGEQCFCPGQRQPNYCDPACVGGANDAAPCVTDDDCGGGFCHPGDCRIDPSDDDSCQEGRCTVGPTTGACSLSSFVSCSTDAQCTAPACPQCALGETCVFDLRQCFVTGEIERCGAAGVPDRTTAAVSCVAGTGQAGIDSLSGAPGPAALTQPETTVVVGF